MQIRNYCALERVQNTNLENVWQIFLSNLKSDFPLLGNGCRRYLIHYVQIQFWFQLIRLKLSDFLLRLKQILRYRLYCPHNFLKIFIAAILSSQICQV